MRTAWTAGLGLGLAVVAIGLHGEGSKAAPAIRLDSVRELEVMNGTAVAETFHGRRAVRLLPLPGHPESDSPFAILSGSDFKDGSIEVDAAGAPAKGSDPTNRGFIGVAFRVQDHGARSESFYLRPTNGRADDQLRRNHSVQYQSAPDFPWSRLRKEAPGVYESYADIQPGVWTRMRIVVAGAKAQLYVNGAVQPCLVVNDLKLGETHGSIALWASGSTDAFFSNLKVR
jgi:hypothetical protein